MNHHSSHIYYIAIIITCIESKLAITCVTMYEGN